MEQKQEKPDDSSPTADSLFGAKVLEDAAAEEISLEKEQPLPQLYILMALANNMFFDAALQSIGYVILGTVFNRNPELNDKKYYLDITFTPEEHNKCWQDFTIHHQTLAGFKLADLTASFDDIVEHVATEIKPILEAADGKMVAGTLRIYVTFDPKGHNGNVQLALAWVEKEK